MSIANLPPSPGLTWDADIEAWFVKKAPDGRHVWVMPMLFTHAIIIGEPDVYGYDDRWCYYTGSVAAAAAQGWSAEPGTEPLGWHRHPASGRRRPGGDPSREYRMQ